MDALDEKKRELFLVLRAQTGDITALDDLLRAVQSRFFRYILNLAANRELAEDILQDVFLIIYRKIGWLNDPQLFRSWVYRIATRETFRVLRKRARWSEAALDDEMLQNIAAPEVKTGEFDLSMLKSVSAASRAVMMLHYLEDLTLKETADVLDISVGTAKSRLAYGLRILRGQIGEAK
jgi:RNA polymerase sigma-70 factor, ECF subfamily